jgi:hypothetical protein
LKEGFEHERKTPKRKTEIKIGTTGLDRCLTEGRKIMRRNSGGVVGRGAWLSDDPPKVETSYEQEEEEDDLRPHSRK